MVDFLPNIIRFSLDPMTAPKHCGGGGANHRMNCVTFGSFGSVLCDMSSSNKKSEICVDW
jgi:hypothetical protein